MAIDSVPLVGITGFILSVFIMVGSVTTTATIGYLIVKLCGILKFKAYESFAKYLYQGNSINIYAPIGDVIKINGREFVVCDTDDSFIDYACVLMDTSTKKFYKVTVGKTGDMIPASLADEYRRFVFNKDIENS